MAYYYPEEMKDVLRKHPEFIDQLYCKGFLISAEFISTSEEYPFYSNWKTQEITVASQKYYIYTHKETYSYTYDDGKRVHFLIGHAYDPFHMVTDENVILQRLSRALENGEESYWDEESNLTGVFFVGYFSEEGVVFSTDCTGMQTTYHGVINGNLYLTSHSKLVADLLGLEQTEYIKRVSSSRFWPPFGTWWLPGDISPYAELRHMQPNFEGVYSAAKSTIELKRYYPVKKVKETTTEEEYRDTIQNLGKIMADTMSCIAKKWEGEKISLSITGGRDSTTALACAKNDYDKFHYFSYISNEDEAVDADAAKKILNHLGLEHELFVIPDDCGDDESYDALQKVMVCNAGCVGNNRANDVKKRLYFIHNKPCDIEVKSWVNEVGRGRYYHKYTKKKFPKQPTPGYFRAMHKIYLSPKMIRETDHIFADYIKNYYDKKTLEFVSWLELYYWEFQTNGSDAVYLTAEHRLSYEITIPFNNRKYLNLMLTVPLQKRIAEDIPSDLIQLEEPRIAETGIVVKDISHTKTRSRLLKLYLEIFSHIHF